MVDRAIYLNCLAAWPINWFTSEGSENGEKPSTLISSGGVVENQP